MLLNFQDSKGCSFFEWIDPEVNGRAKDLIAELNHQKTQLQEKLVETEAKLAKKNEKLMKVKKEKKNQSRIFCSILIILVAMFVTKLVKTNPPSLLCLV